jgi:NAD(P)-dependent dehydrogenase (short-subunit alcohol dehydrogenase family)
MGKLGGKIAIIAGGSCGIGLATAQRFVNQGAYVFISGRRQSEFEAAWLVGRLERPQDSRERRRPGVRSFSRLQQR